MIYLFNFSKKSSVKVEGGVVVATLHQKFLGNKAPGGKPCALKIFGWNFVTLVTLSSITNIKSLLIKGNKAVTKKQKRVVSVTNLLQVVTNFDVTEMQQKFSSYNFVTGCYSLQLLSLLVFQRIYIKSNGVTAFNTATVFPLPLAKTVFTKTTKNLTSCR